MTPLKNKVKKKPATSRKYNRPPAKANPAFLYDGRCDDVFADRVHTMMFRVSMLSIPARDSIPVGRQYEIACEIEAEIEKLETKLCRSLPSAVVTHLVDNMLIEMERPVPA